MAIIKTVNAEGGSDARYDVSRMNAQERTQFDSEGRPLGSDNPDQWVWTPGLPGARGGGSPGGGSSGSVGGDVSNPYFNQLKSSFEAQSAADLSRTKAALQQALIGFGLIPEGFTDKLNVLDNLTKDLIAKNTESGISSYARLLEQKSDAQRELVNRLQRNGLRRSGARGYKMRRGQLDWDRLFQDSLQQLMGHTSGLYDQYTSNEQSRQNQLLQAMMNMGSLGQVNVNNGGASFAPSNPYSFSAAQRGSTANGGTQTSFGSFARSLPGLVTGTSVTSPVFSGSGSLANRPE